MYSKEKFSFLQLQRSFEEKNAVLAHLETSLAGTTSMSARFNSTLISHYMSQNLLSDFLCNNVFYVTSLASRQELTLKKSLGDQMERALQEQKKEIEVRDTQSVQHSQKLEKLEEQADKATQQVRKMEVSLAECHKEIEMYVEQLKEARSAHEQELEEKGLEVRSKRSTNLTIYDSCVLFRRFVARFLEKRFR